MSPDELKVFGREMAKARGRLASTIEPSSPGEWLDDQQGGARCAITRNGAEYELRLDRGYCEEKWAARLYRVEPGGSLAPLLTDRWSWHDSLDDAAAAGCALLEEASR